jgi:hypothetical protein
LVHEAGVAVLRVAPDKFWEFSAALFKQQNDFFDVSVVNETRNKTYERLAKIAGSVGVEEREVLKLLTVSENADGDGKLNVGNGVTNDIKLMVKVSMRASVISGYIGSNTEFSGRPCGWSPCLPDCVLQCMPVLVAQIITTT